MGLFENNLRELGQLNAELLGKLSIAAKTLSPDEKHVFWGVNQSGEKIAVIEKNGRRVCMESMYSASFQLDIWLRSYVEYFREDSVIYLFGFGSGKGVRKCLMNIGEDGVLFVYEPSLEFFLELLGVEDLSDIFQNRRVHLIIGGVNNDKVYDMLRLQNQKKRIRTEQIVILSLPQYRELYRDENEWYYQELLDFRVLQEQNKLTVLHFLPSTVEGVLHKIRYYKNAIPAERLKEEWDRDLPVILISAGPSLDKNKKYLHEAKGKMLIAAVDMALPALHDEGVVPDLIVSLDAGVKDEYVCIKDYDKVPLLCNTSTGEGLFDWGTGERILFREKPFLQNIKECAGLPNEPYGFFGSVSVAAFAVFSMLGSKTIILIGQDLAYRADGKTHAGSYNELKGESVDYLPGYYGGEVETRSDWLGFWNWYKRQIPSMKETRVINATEGGAHIPGTVQMPLQQVISEFRGRKEFDHSKVFNSKQRTTEVEYNKMVSYIEKGIEEVRLFSQWNEEIFEKNRKELHTFISYLLIDEVMSVMEGDTEWLRFSQAVEFMLKHGWDKEKECG